MKRKVRSRSSRGATVPLRGRPPESIRVALRRDGMPHVRRGGFATRHVVIPPPSKRGGGLPHRRPRTGCQKLPLGRAIGARSTAKRAWARCAPRPLKLLAPGAGFEPATNRLTVDCSTAELSGTGGGVIAAPLRLRNPLSAECTQLLWRPSFCVVGGCSRPRHVVIAALGASLRRGARGRPRGGVVTQRTANPCTPVRFRARPPNFFQKID